jgi:hypothetical protein
MAGRIVVERRGRKSRREIQPEIPGQADGVSRPAYGDRNRADCVFEDQVPSDDQAINSPSVA